MGAKKPKVDKDAKRDAKRERRLSAIERSRAAQKNAAGLTSDLRGVYGLQGMSMFNQALNTSASSPTAPNVFSVLNK